MSYEKQKQKIINFYKTHKRMPSYSEITKLVGFASKNAAYRLALKLINEGLIEKDNTGRLIPGRIFGKLKLLGLVEAGFPSVAEEALADTVSIDDYLIENYSATYLLKVKGLSMQDAGIVEGDLVVVERTSSAKVGDIVIANVDGEFTMKFLRKKRTQFYLEPANKDFQDIHPEGALEISAVVKGVVRKY